MFYFLEDLSPPDLGVIVFDELEKARSHILIEQALRYFTDSATVRHRASLILPEPLFVHSELTTGVQIADLIAYVVSWAFRLPAMTTPALSEMESFSRKVAGLRYRAVRARDGNPNFVIWSFAYVTDLRTRMERGYVEQQKRQCDARAPRSLRP